MTSNQTTAGVSTTAPGKGFRPSPGAGGFTRIISSIFRVREMSVLIVNIVLIGYFAIANPAFMTAGNIANIADFFSAVAMIAVAEVFLLICGEIDLSSGMTFALIPIIMMTLNNDGMQLWLALLISLMFAVLIGVFNGVISQFLKLPSFIATLGTMYLLHGFALTLAGSTPISAPTDGVLVNIFGGFQWSELIWALAIGFILHILLTQTRYGVHTIASGANLLGASEAGIRVIWARCEHLSSPLS